MALYQEGALEADGKSFKAGVTKETSVNKIGHGELIFAFISS